MSYPQTIYVTEESDEDGDPYLDASDNLEWHAVVGETVEVAVYELKEMIKVTAQVKFERIGR